MNRDGVRRDALSGAVGRQGFHLFPYLSLLVFAFSRLYGFIL